MIAAMTGLVLCAVLASDPPQLAATFYPWYEWPDRHLGHGADAAPLRHHPLAPEACDPTAVAWLRGELDAAAAAGLDALLVANVPAPARLEATFRALGLALEQRAEAGAPPIAIGVYLDPLFAAVDLAGGEGAATAPRIDLRDAGVRQAFLAPLDHWFAAIPERARARLDGKPLVVVGGDGAIAACPPDFFDILEQEAPTRFGEVPALVIDSSWNLEARPAWRRGAPLFGPQRSGAVASVGPGWLDAGTARGMIRPPASRAAFLAELAPLLAAPPALTIVESWNQFHDGSAVAPTLENGTRFVGALRAWKAALATPERAAAWPPAAPAPLVLERAWAPDRDCVLQNHIDWRADGSGSGLRLVELQPAVAAASARFDVERDSLSAAAPATTFVLEVPPAFRSDTPAAFELRVAATGEARFSLAVEGAPDVAVAALEADAPRFALAAWSTGAAPRLRLTADAPIELGGVTLERRDRRFPDQPLGIDDPGLFATAWAEGAGELVAARARIAQAAALGARWLRVELDWEGVEARGAIDWRVPRQLVAAIRAAGLEPIVALTSAPQRARPLAAQGETIAAFVSELRRECGDGLRAVELFPGANQPQTFAPQPDLPGVLRMLRAVALRLHSEAPDLALLAGGVAGPDRDWCDSFRALREPWHADVMALQVDDAFGAAGSVTQARQLATVAAALPARPGQRTLLTLRPTVSPRDARTRELEAASASTIGAVVAAALDRCERHGEPLHLLDAGDLPCIGGHSVAAARAALTASGHPVVVEPLVRLLQALTDGSARNCVVASGEWWPAELIAAVPEFIDRGGLLIALGGPPALEAATLEPDASWSMHGHADGLALADDLRIGWWPWRARLEPLSPELILAAGRTFPALAPPATRPPIAALYRRRTGEPRDPRGYHRYDEILSLVGPDRDARAEVAALLQYQGGREGALLLIGFGGSVGLLDEATQAQALSAMLAAIRTAPATRDAIVLWRGLFDGDDDAAGLLRADATLRPAAEAFRASAR